MDNGKIGDKLKNNFHTWNSYCADEGIELCGGCGGVWRDSWGSSRKDTPCRFERVIININFRRCESGRNRKKMHR